jgi:hypothetical protein
MPARRHEAIQDVRLNWHGEGEYDNVLFAQGYVDEYGAWWNGD